MVEEEVFRLELPDLDEMDEAEQNREVYAGAGLALYFAQVFEQGMIHAVYLAQIANGTLAMEFSSADAFHEVVDKQTAGAIIKRVFKHAALSAEVADHCAECVEKRNFLAHRFFSERSELFFHPGGRRLMLEELRVMIETFQCADAELEAVMFGYGEKINFTPDLVQQLMRAISEEAHPVGRNPQEVVDEIIRRTRPEWPENC